MYQKSTWVNLNNLFVNLHRVINRAKREILQNAIFYTSKFPDAIKKKRSLSTSKCHFETHIQTMIHSRQFNFDSIQKKIYT
ncbi:hypothetical protein T09_14470 [Trichinella sp. T9]|nr:hypothetical protein T09_14470 [Trichinella sp. T9]